ncbi:MAG: SRPBCC domain-containing protein [Thermoplasmata archaeon]
MKDPPTIRWPERFAPDRAPVHVRNEIDVPVPPAQVWPWLVRAVLWPTWYSNASHMQIVGGGADLGPGTEFRWRTFSAPLRSKVEEFVPPERLAWSARGPGVDVYHAWLITPTPAGSHVLTEESQYGSLARLDHATRPGRMFEGHESWLRGLKERAMGGPPPPP